MDAEKPKEKKRRGEGRVKGNKERERETDVWKFINRKRKKECEKRMT